MGLRKCPRKRRPARHLSAEPAITARIPPTPPFWDFSKMASKSFRDFFETLHAFDRAGKSLDSLTVSFLTTL
jgi:hypothetical protein